MEDLILTMVEPLGEFPDDIEIEEGDTVEFEQYEDGMRYAKWVKVKVTHIDRTVAPTLYTVELPDGSHYDAANLALARDLTAYQPPLTQQFANTGHLTDHPPLALEWRLGRNMFDAALGPERGAHGARRQHSWTERTLRSA